MRKCIGFLGGIAAIVAAVVAVLVLPGNEDGRRPDKPRLITVSPAVGDPKTTFVVKARAAVIPVVRGGRNYQFIMSGPGPPACHGRRHSELGYDIPQAGYYVARYRPRHDPLDPTARLEDWCPGRYRGRVEYRDPGDRRNNKVIGRFVFTVRGRTSSGRRLTVAR